MSSTDDLIVSLSSQAEPVRRLRSPVLRAAGWIALASALIALLAAVRGYRLDLPGLLHDPAYLTGISAAWITGAMATLAAFEISLPDRSRYWVLLPILPLILWLWGVGYGCLAHWVAIPFGAPVSHDSMRCLETLIGASIPLGLVLFLSLRKSHPLRMTDTAWLGALAVAAFADTAHLLIHVVQATIMVLIMNFGVVAVILGAATLAGRRLLER